MTLQPDNFGCAPAARAKTRREKPASGGIAAGAIRAVAWAILRCDRNPNRPENGVLSFDIREMT